MVEVEKNPLNKLVSTTYLATTRKTGRYHISGAFLFILTSVKKKKRENSQFLKK